MKRLKFSRKTAVITTLLIGLFLIGLYWCNHNYSDETIRPYEVDFSNLDRKLLIVTQDSPFKDSVTAMVSGHFKSVPITVEVIDFKALSNTNAADFDAIFLMYRWEAGAPPETVQSFMDKNLSLKNKMVELTTSWNGLEKRKNVDAITGASIVENVPIFTNQIIKKINKLLK